MRWNNVLRLFIPFFPFTFFISCEEEKKIAHEIVSYIKLNASEFGWSIDCRRIEYGHICYTLCIIRYNRKGSGRMRVIHRDGFISHETNFQSIFQWPIQNLFHCINHMQTMPQQWLAINEHTHKTNKHTVNKTKCQYFRLYV